MSSYRAVHLKLTVLYVGYSSIKLGGKERKQKKTSETLLFMRHFWASRKMNKKSSLLIRGIRCHFTLRENLVLRGSPYPRGNHVSWNGPITSFSSLWRWPCTPPEPSLSSQERFLFRKLEFFLCLRKLETHSAKKLKNHSWLKQNHINRINRFWKLCYE